MKYKVAFFLPNLESQGGVVVSVKTIAEYLQTLGHEVHLFPIGDTKVSNSTYIHPIDSNNKAQQLKIAKNLYALETTKKPFDLSVSNTLVSNYILHHLHIENTHLMILRQPSFLKQSHIFSKIKKRILFPKIYNRKNIVMISECLLNNFLQRFGYLKLKSSRVIYNAFDPEFLEKKSQQNIELPTSKEYIISVGRFTKTKNHTMLIKAFAHIDNKNIDLILLGEGKEKNALKHLIEKLNLNHKVHFVDWQENPYPYIKQAKLLVHTSKSETFGRVILEGLALGTPVVATDIDCGPNEILTKELSKFLVPSDNINVLTFTINRALNSYPNIIADKYLMQFDIKHIAQQYIDFIEKEAK